MNKSLFVIAALGSTLAGCTPPPLQFTPPNVGLSQVRHDAALVSTIVSVAPKAEAKGKVDLAGVEMNVTQLWKSALEDTILRMAIFKDASPKRLTLAVKILKFDSSGLGSSVQTIARYELIDRNNGDIVYTTDIDAKGKAADYVGDNRLRNAVSRSVQENIAQFLNQIEGADLSKAAFPAGTPKVAQ